MYVRACAFIDVSRTRFRIECSYAPDQLWTAIRFLLSFPHRPALSLYSAGWWVDKTFIYTSASVQNMHEMVSTESNLSQSRILPPSFNRTPLAWVWWLVKPHHLPVFSFRWYTTLSPISIRSCSMTCSPCWEPRHTRHKNRKRERPPENSTAVVAAEKGRGGKMRGLTNKRKDRERGKGGYSLLCHSPVKWKE